MIYSFGDSHSDNTFRGTGVNINKRMGMTMHRVGRDKVALPTIKDGGKVIWCFGEIDVRCHIHKQRADRPLEEIIGTLATAYIENVVLQTSLQNCTSLVMSVIPPAYKENSRENKEVPFLGSDEERCQYTILLNQKLKNLCEKEGIQYLDVYSLLVDVNGMLTRELSDGHVHVGNTAPIEQHLKEIGLIP